MIKRYFIYCIVLAQITIPLFSRIYSPGVAARIILNSQSTQTEIEQAVKDVAPAWRKLHTQVINNALTRVRKNIPKQKSVSLYPSKDFVEYYPNPLLVKNQNEEDSPLMVNQTVIANPELYNTQFLRRKKEVRELLLTKEGFSEDVIKTSSKIFSSMLYKIVPGAHYSLVCFGGWGMAKESLAPLYEMMKDQPCNIFLCETRTVHQSLIQNAWEFGAYSDQDVIQCLSAAHALTPTVPLVVWGTCAGAFYATRALVELNKAKKISVYNIAGLIFDSGWGAVDEAIVTQLKGRIKEKLARSMVPGAGYTDYRDAEGSFFVKTLSTISNWLIDAFSRYTINPLYMYRTYNTNLAHTIDTLSLPIFFIHSKDDWLKPLSMSHQLYVKSRNKIAWWIEQPSTHSMHHFKHKEEYKKRCIEFIRTKVLNPLSA